VGELVVAVRLYNPTSQAITLDGSSLSTIYTSGLADGQFPVGNAVLPTAPVLPVIAPAGLSQDVELHFAWNGDIYAGLVIGGYQYILTLGPPP
jgi:hypothetical protein